MNDYRGLLIKKRRKELDISLEALSHGINIGYSNAKNHPKRSESWQFLNLQQHLVFLS